MSADLMKVVALVSGRGSNLQAILDAIMAGTLAVELAAVISNRPDAMALQRAREAGVPVVVVDHRDYADKSAFEAALTAAIDSHKPELVVLAGFMRILTPDFVQHYRGRMINVHPALLPAFQGLNTHQRALDAGVTRHGASVHFVTPEVDGGPIIIQAAVPVLPDDRAETLADRVLEQEHRILPQAIAWFAAGRLTISGHRVLLDGKISPEQGLEKESGA